MGAEGVGGDHREGGAAVSDRAEELIAGLTELADKLERGEPVEVTEVTREETPDGPLHTSRKKPLPRPAVAIVCYDGAGEPEVAFTVKLIVPTVEEAEREVARLNELNGGNGCRYFWTPTRVK
jgi:hypothetical protein